MSNDLSFPQYASAEINALLAKIIPPEKRCQPVSSTSFFWEQLQRKESAYLTISKDGLKIALAVAIAPKPLELGMEEIEQTFWNFIEKELVFGDYSPCGELERIVKGTWSGQTFTPDPEAAKEEETPRFKGLISYAESVSYEIHVFSGDKKDCFEMIAAYAQELNMKNMIPFCGGIVLSNQQRPSVSVKHENTSLWLHFFHDEAVEANELLVYLYQPTLWEWRYVVPLGGVNALPHTYDLDESVAMVMIGAPIYDGIVKTIRVKMA